MRRTAGACPISLAAEPAPGTPQQFGAFIRAEIDKWAAVVKTANMKAE